jgi:hypothetical protein
VPLPGLVVKKGSKTCGRMSGGMPQPVSLTQISMLSTKVSFLAETGDTSAVRRCLGRIDQQIHQHLRKLIGIHQDVRQVFGNLVLRSFAAQRRLAFEKAKRIRNQAMQAEIAQYQWDRDGHN